MNMGKSPYRASLEAADEIGLAVIAISLTIVAIFAPVSFMGGIAGQYFKQFGLTVAAAVLISLLVARLITPMMAAYLLKPVKEVHLEDGTSCAPTRASSGARCASGRSRSRRHRVLLRLDLRDRPAALGLHSGWRRIAHRRCRRAAAGLQARGHDEDDRRHHPHLEGHPRGQVRLCPWRHLADRPARRAPLDAHRPPCPEGRAQPRAKSRSSAKSWRASSPCPTRAAGPSTAATSASLRSICSPPTATRCAKRPARSKPRCARTRTSAGRLRSRPRAAGNPCRAPLRRRRQARRIDGSDFGDHPRCDPRRR